MIAVPTGFAFNEPDGYKNLKLGMSRDEVRKALGYGEHVAPHHLQGLHDDSIGPIQVQFLLAYEQNALDSVLILFKSDDFEELERIFVMRYGKATSTIDIPVQTPAGARYINRQLTWLGKKAYVTMRKYGDKIGQGFATIGTVEGLVKQRREREKAMRDAAKGL